MVVMVIVPQPAPSGIPTKATGPKAQNSAQTTLPLPLTLATA